MTEAELYQNINEWKAFCRRHHANVFNAIFKDVDYGMDDDMLNTALADAAAFFGLDVPEVHNWSDTLAKMEKKNDFEEDSELYYNLMLLFNNGINNQDALSLCMAHEMAHLYFKDVRFNLCNNELWCQELAADFMVGYYSARRCLATAKYKFLVSMTTMTCTHPQGNHRLAAVEFARKYSGENPGNNLSSIQCGIPLFILERQKELNDEWEHVLNRMFD